WQGNYHCLRHNSLIEVHSQPGVGDVVAQLQNNRFLRVECKKGPLSRTPGSPEYALLRGAIGHLLTLDQVNSNDIIAVAVPSSEQFRLLANRWRGAPLVKRCDIRILLVSRDGKVEGLDETGQYGA